MKPYSIDLRKRALEAVNDVMNLDKVVEAFQFENNLLLARVTENYG